MPAQEVTVPLVGDYACDVKAAPAPLAPLEEAHDVIYFVEEHPRARFCRSLFSLILFLMLGWFVGSLAVSAFGMADSDALSVLVVSCRAASNDRLLPKGLGGYPCQVGPRRGRRCGTDPQRTPSNCCEYD